MSKKLFTKDEVKILSKNKYVKKVSSKGITYTDEFKKIFITENELGKFPRQIFEESGFDIEILGMQRVGSADKRWRRSYKNGGAIALQDTRRLNTGIPSEKELSLAEKFARLEAKVELLQTENELLKKLDMLERKGLKKKYNIICPIRKANPYRRMMKATKAHTVVPNLLNRKFKQKTPRKILLTDITYLTYKNNQRAYLSTIKDSSTNEILAYNVSDNLKLDIVIDTLKKLKLNSNIKLHSEAYIHSDQGVHYTSPKVQKVIQELGLGQSGNCWDNAPQESFFGHFKDEVDLNLNQLKIEIDNYMNYYNNYRYQWNLNKMTPVQYRNHLII